MIFHSPRTLCACTCFLVMAVTAIGQEAPSLEGTWEGEVKLPGAPLSIVVHFAPDERGRVGGTLSIPMEAAWDLPLSDVAVTGESVRFRVEGMPGDASFEGHLGRDGREMRGTLRQNGQSFLFRIDRRPGSGPESGAGKERNGRATGGLAPPQGV